MAPRDERVAVVSGGNRGIGLETVRMLSELGIRVVLGSRSLAAGVAARERLGAAAANVVPHRLDVTDVDSVGALADRLGREFGRCDILVNNAAVQLDATDHATSVDLDLVRQTFEVNLYGAWRLTQRVAPLMRERHYGRIVNVTSLAGQMATIGAGFAGYRISKTALNALTRVFAAELRGDGILVNAYCPGKTLTDMGGWRRGRPAAEAADTAIWLATLPDDGPTGSLFRDRRAVEW